MNIVLQNDFKRQWADTRDAAMEAFSRVGESGWYILGQEVRLLESALAELWNRNYAVTVASGLDALEIALRILGCGAGDRVLTTPLSAFATTLAIARIGAIPVFVDTDERGLLDLAQCRELLRRRGDIRFLLPVHLYGYSLNLQDLAALRDQFGCKIVEDCAQSVLARFRGVATGAIGEVAATSFYPTKNLGALGDGGAIVCDSESLSRSASVLRDYGQSAKYRHESIGCNSRLDELQAALLRTAHMPRLLGWAARRRQIAARYTDHLSGPAVRPLGVCPGEEPAWHLFPVVVEESDKREFLRYLAANGITAGEHYPVAIPDQPAMAQVQHEIIGPCSRARDLARREVSLPVHPYLTDSEVDRVIEVCRRWRT